MRSIVAVVVLASGCSVEIGAGDIAPVAIDAPVDDSSDPPLSMPVDVEFLSADDAQAIADQYGSKLGAVTAVDLVIQELDVTDGSGAPIPGGSLVVEFDGLTLAKVGVRVRLPDATKQQLLGAIQAHAEFDLTVQATINWSLPAPPLMDAHAVVQPIFVVDALKAL
ncbi:MAG TPA: hypothetical protein VF334_22485 [Polyangia bacterium]